MLLSTQTEFFGKVYGDAAAIRMIKAAGFDAFDMSFFEMFGDKDYPMNGDNWRDYVRSLRAVADECGIVCNQAHAPFASSAGDEEDDKRRFAAIVRSMEAAAMLGAKVIVVHPKQHLPYTTCKDALFDMNVQFYRALLPYCEQFGIKVACENMWHYNHAAGRIIDSTCSRPEEFCAYLDAVDSPFLVACLDIGHTALTDEELPYFIKTLGKERLQALHVHDNDLHGDDHTLPFTRKIDFSAVTAALSDIGYAGDLTFEADNFLRPFPQPLHADAAHFMCRVGRQLMCMIQE